jgi:glycosyltransferase involved in cell wall biosynthesis
MDQAPVKIVQALGWYFPESLGGTEVYVATLSRAFAAAGHKVRVAAPDTVGGERTYAHDGTQVYRYPIPAHPTRDEAQGSRTVRGAHRFHEWLAGERPDVVHFHTFVTGLGLPELHAARACGAKTVVTTHSSSLGFLCARGTLMQWGDAPCDGIAIPSKCAACALDQRGLPRVFAQALGGVPAAVARAGAIVPGPLGSALGMSDFIRRNIARQHELLAAADRFVVLTEGGRQMLRANDFDNGKVVVNRLGVASLSDRVNGRRERAGPVTVGYLGRFDVIKGVDVFARAVALLERDVPIAIEFRGPVQSARERSVRDALAARLAGDDRVRFADAVSHDAVADVLRDYDVLCCPAICFEGGPTVALEAQAVGTPVVGSRIGGLAEIVRDGVDGRLVPANDAGALAAALREVARDPEHTIDLWRANAPTPRTMAQVASDYLRLYEAY